MSSKPQKQGFTAEILPQLQEWFEFNYRSGCTPAQMKLTLLEAGYAAKSAERFLERQCARLSLGDSGDAAPLASPETALDRLWRRTEVLNSFNNIMLGEHIARIIVKNAGLGIYFLTDFLTDRECDLLIAQSQPNLSQSTVVDDASRGDVLTANRSSKGASLGRASSHLVKTIESRIARLTNVPIAHGEGLQMLHYGPGEEYRPHFDYFDPASSGGAENLTRGSQRLATVIMYLSEVECGGGTSFPALSLEFVPRKGAALLFSTIAKSGDLNSSSLHAGLPVTSGEKWIATKWLRMTPYQSDTNEI